MQHPSPPTHLQLVCLHQPLAEPPRRAHRRKQRGPQRGVSLARHADHNFRGLRELRDEVGGSHQQRPRADATAAAAGSRGRRRVLLLGIKFQGSEQQPLQRAVEVRPSRVPPAAVGRQRGAMAEAGVGDNKPYNGQVAQAPRHFLLPASACAVPQKLPAHTPSPGCPPAQPALPPLPTWPAPEHPPAAPSAAAGAAGKAAPAGSPAGGAGRGTGQPPEGRRCCEPCAA